MFWNGECRETRVIRDTPYRYRRGNTPNVLVIYLNPDPQMLS